MSKTAEDFHEWAARLCWDGIEPPRVPSLWNPSNTAQMLTALDLHRMAKPDCETCAKGRAK